MLIVEEISNGVFNILIPGQPFIDASGKSYPWQLVSDWDDDILRHSNLYRISGPIGPLGTHLKSLSFQRQGNIVVAVSEFTSPEIEISNAIANAISNSSRTEFNI